MRPVLAAMLVALLPLAAPAAASHTVVLDVQNMTCGLCPLTVRKSLQKVDGVAAVQVDFAQKTATVTFDAGKTQTPALIQATTQAGFPSTVRR